MGQGGPAGSMEADVLVLSRKSGESLFLPDLGIEIKVIEIRPYVVRIGVAAPKDVAVLRDDAIDTYGRHGKEVVHVDVRSDSK